LAQHLEPQPGFEDALLGQELISLGVIFVLGLIAVWVGQSLLVARGTLLSAAAPIAAGGTRSRSDAGRDRGGEMHKLFSTLTHDLRSPLTSIKAASTLMLDRAEEIDEGGRTELLETIRESSDGLDRMITNAVQLSRSRAGELQPQKIPASMDEVASRALERLRHRLRDHHVVLVIPEDLPEVPVDVVQLDQALANVLENAATFSPAGTEIALSLERRNGSLLVRVEDRGPGIPSEQREYVFKPFVKLAAGGGAGLGLPISRAIVEAHGGRMMIEDAPGGAGTVVIVELPLDPSMLVVPELTREVLP
jgi:two-component system sensor histidine kinase KdpD